MPGDRLGVRGIGSVSVEQADLRGYQDSQSDGRGTDRELVGRDDNGFDGDDLGGQWQHGGGHRIFEPDGAWEQLRDGRVQWTVQSGGDGMRGDGLGVRDLDLV
mmetsp:Transcript_29238/g.45806  ORF Transcript_29238/g.45806 Transcript_29238/m.45806 type:complete len:103 (+) Transcript_29238:685-993(+)